MRNCYWIGTLIIFMFSLSGCSSEIPNSVNPPTVQIPTNKTKPIFPQENLTIFDLRDEATFGHFGTSIYHVSTTSSGDVWINLKNAVGKFNGEKWMIYPMNKSMVVSADQTIGSGDVFLALPDNKIWITLRKDEEDFPHEVIHYLYFFDGKKWIAYTKENGLLEDNVYSAAADNLTGNMWFATSGVALDNGWFETFYAGVSSFDGASWTSYQRIQGSLAVDSAGMLWAFSGQDIFSFDGTNLTTHEKIRDKLFSDNCKSWESHITDIVDMDFSPDGTVWVLFQECGIAKYYKGEWSGYENSEILTLNFDGTSEICISPNGKLWLLRGHNLYEYDTHSNILHKQPILLPITSSLACASDNSVWIGMLSGYVGKYTP